MKFRENPVPLHTLGDIQVIVYYLFRKLNAFVTTDMCDTLLPLFNNMQYSCRNFCIFVSGHFNKILTMRKMAIGNVLGRTVLLERKPSYT